MGFVTDIAGKGDGRAVGVGYLGHQRIELGLAAGGDDDLGAFLGEEFRGGAADAGTGAGDDGDLVGECEHGCRPSVGPVWPTGAGNEVP